MYNARDEKDEANFVAKEIIKLAGLGYSYNDMAVLMRANAFSRNFEETFLSYNIPHRIYGGFKFYDRTEIRNIVSYLRIFVNAKDQISLLKIINFPRRSVGEVAQKKLVESAKNLNKTVLEMLEEGSFEDKKILKKLENFIKNYEILKEDFKKLKLYDFVKKLIKLFEIESAYSSKSSEDEERLANIDSFLSSVKEYEDANKDSSLKEFLENITLQTDTDDIKENGTVNIATIHSVKGLEFKVVFIVALEEQIMPSRHAYHNASDMEEERRLMYVALTRAEKLLYLTYASSRFMYGKSSYPAPSRFLRELGLVKSRPNIFEQISALKTLKTEKVVQEISKYKVGQIVEHLKYGKGVIKNITEDGLVADIEFEDFGTKSLMLEFAPLSEYKEE